MTIQQRDWIYDESKQCGTDYLDPVNADQYDERHEKFRDFQAEAERIITFLRISSDDTVIDLGTGTGSIAVHLAKQCRKVYAVDVSETMLEKCRQKCTDASVNNVEFCQGGFLSYHHTEPVDAIVSQHALHHLPDMWKQVAMLRCYDMLKPDGTFWLMDLVFPFEARDYEPAIQEWVDTHVPIAGPEAALHIKEEFSTMGWIMEGILERTGFVIEHIQDCQSFIKGYVCRKPASEKDK